MIVHLNIWKARFHLKRHFDKIVADAKGFEKAKKDPKEEILQEQKQEEDQPLMEHKDNTGEERDEKGKNEKVYQIELQVNENENEKVPENKEDQETELNVERHVKEYAKVMKNRIYDELKGNSKLRS